MANFTTKGDVLALRVGAKDEHVTVAVSGTYNQTIKFQREIGSFGSGAWVTIKTFDTEDATESYPYVTRKDDEHLRLVLAIDNGGTAVVTLTEDGTDRILHQLFDRQGNLLATYRESGVQFADAVTVDGTLAVVGETDAASLAPVSVTTDTLAVTHALHAGRTLVLNRAAGIALTLPAATGSGDKYTMVVGTTFSGAATVAVAASPGTDIMKGTAILFADAGNTVVAFATAADSDTMSMFGTALSNGGVAGAKAVFTDIATGVWHVEYVSDAGGAEATPFSANVAAP